MATSPIRPWDAPESNVQLNEKDVEVLHETRRVLWEGGVRGLFAGLVGGLVAWPVLKQLEARNILKGVKLEPRHRTGLVLSLGTIGMIVASTVAGKNNSYRLHGLFEKGADPTYSRYQRVKKGIEGGKYTEEDKIIEKDLQMKLGAKESGAGQRAVRSFKTNKYGDRVV